MRIVEEKMTNIFVSMVPMKYVAFGMENILMSLIIKHMLYMIMLSDQFLKSCLTVKHQTINSQQMNGISIRPPKV